MKVVALFVMRGFKVLMVRNQEKNCWGLPGGKVEKGEREDLAL